MSKIKDAISAIKSGVERSVKGWTVRAAALLRGRFKCSSS
jgi:hypothetical protein